MSKGALTPRMELYLFQGLKSVKNYVDKYSREYATWKALKERGFASETNSDQRGWSIFTLTEEGKAKANSLFEKNQKDQTK